MARTINNRNPHIEEAYMAKAGLHETHHKKDRKRGGGRNRTEELLNEWEEDLEFYEREDDDGSQ